MTVENLSQLKCEACRGDTPRLSDREILELWMSLDAWTLHSKESIQKEISFKGLKRAIDFFVLLGELADAEDHHPDVFISARGKMHITFTTYAIAGLSKNDFIMAAKVDELVKQFKTK